MNCQNCGYKYCPFRGSDREIPAYFCEDYEPAKVMDALLHEQYGYLCEDAIRAIPTANVDPVVLCRDCEYYQADCGWCGLLDIGMNVNDFCSRGVKRECDT